MDEQEVDEKTREACNLIEEKGYAPSMGDQSRYQEKKLPFLTPFYFKIKLLDRYLKDDDYFINWYTETTGSIGHYDKWDIKFGINKNGNIQVWYGDLEQIPNNEQARFFADKVNDTKPSFNFIRAELMCAPANIPHLTNIFHLRESINKNFHEKFNSALFLDKENSQELFTKICRPLYDSKEELTRTLSKINKLFTESLNISNLKEIINNQEKCKEKGSIKTLEVFLEDIFSKSDFDNIIRSFYILDDFRISDTHAGVEDKFTFCLSRLKITDNNYSVAYEKMLVSLKESLKELNEVLQNYNQNPKQLKK